MIEAETHADLDLASLRDLAARWALAWSKPMTESDSLFVGLWGAMGAGKTTFVQAFVCALPQGRAEDVTSPTFALVQDYPCVPPVMHLDLYRLNDEADVEEIGGPELFAQPGFIFVEWPDRARAWLPADRVDLEFTVQSERRTLRLTPFGHPNAGGPT